jgi:hypothetical protein
LERKGTSSRIDLENLSKQKAYSLIWHLWHICTVISSWSINYLSHIIKLNNCSSDVKKLKKNYFLAQPIGLIRLSCPSVLTHDNSRTERVRGFKFCTNTSYVNSDYVSENGPHRVIRRTAGLLIPVISARFESVAYKYVASFMIISNSKALLTDRLQIVEFQMKYLNATKSQVNSAS